MRKCEYKPEIRLYLKGKGLIRTLKPTTHHYSEIYRIIDSGLNPTSFLIHHKLKLFTTDSIETQVKIYFR